MADNGCAPPLSPNSVNEYLEHTSKRFTTPLGGSSVVVSESREYTFSHANANYRRLVPTPPPPQFVSRGRSGVLPRKFDEDQTPPSSKKPRGRPPGSKNKPKLPIIIREDTDTFLKPVIIEIPDGHDIIETLINLAKHRHAGITVLSGSGFIQEVTLRLPMSRVVADPLQGPLFMLSLSGTYVNEDCGRVPPQFITKPPSFSFYINFSDADTGHVFGRGVGGTVKASGAVIVTATLFKKPEFHRVGIVNGIIDEIEEDGPRYAGGVINNVDRSAAAIEPNNYNIINNTAIIGSVGFDVATSSGNLAPLHHRQLPPLPIDVNVMQSMQWSHHTRPDNY